MIKAHKRPNSSVRQSMLQPPATKTSFLLERSMWRQTQRNVAVITHAQPMMVMKASAVSTVQPSSPQ